MRHRTSRVAGGCRRKRQSGITVILVLGLLSVTLALCYAMIRTQATIEEVQRNAGFRGSSQQAAQAGLSIGLRAMRKASWGGVATTIQGQLDDNTSYAVSYATGDASLRPTDPDYDEYPYRVTVTATGTAVDPANPTVQSTYTVQAIAQLVRRKLADQPSSWTAMSPYTVYQWGTGGGREVDIEAPVQVQGSVFCQNEISYLEDYPNDGDDKAFDGSIDEVALLGAALSQGQVQIVGAGTISLDQLVAIPGANALAYWKLDETSGATVAVDQLGNYNGRYDGAKAGSTAMPVLGGSAAAAFDGFNDHVDLGPVDMAGSAMTILAWFKVDSFYRSDGRIISKATGASTSEHYWMLSTIASSGHYRLRFRLRTGGTTSTLIASSGDIPTDTWVFAAAVYDGSTMKLYQDGVLVGSMSKSGTINSSSSVRASLGNNSPGSPRAKLLRDLQAMHVAGEGDYRPFTGAITAPLSLTSSQNRSLLTEETAVTLTNTSQGGGSAPVTDPDEIASYQLYPGGAVYYPTELSSSISGVTYAPNPKTNPLGLVKRYSALRVYSNVEIQGTLLTYGSGSGDDLELRGTGVKLTPVTLPSIYGDSTVRQLPAIVCGDDLRVYDGSESTISGMVIAWDDLDCPESSQATTLSIEGRVAVGELELQARSEWDRSEWWWKTRLHEFLNQLDGASPIAYFPKWLKEEHALDYEPKITIKPDSAGVTYHWHDWSQPLFVAHPDDGGLRWDVLRWVDSP